MTKILGLDLGTTSIGFALIEEKENKKEIIMMGSRIIPLSVDDKNQFSQGNAISKNQDRTTKRTQRKGYDRYQQRRANLAKELNKLEMFPDENLWKLSSLEIYGLRDKAVKGKIELKELGRIFLHLNQKRGYKSICKEENTDKKDTEYVAQVKGRHQTIKDLGLTIGQYFYKNLKQDYDNNLADGKSFITYRIKEQIFPREAYTEEFEVIWNEQAKHYPTILTKDFKDKVKDGIIFYQRPLKSQKGLVSVCDFEGFTVKKDIRGKEKILFVGPKVAPKTSPLFQVSKIWETINTLTLKSKKGEDLVLSIEQKKEIFEHLDNNEKLSQADLFKILKINKDDYYGNKQIGRGLQGNLTKVAIAKILGDNHPLLNLNIQIESTNKEVYLVDRKTGEVIGSNNFQIVSPNIEKEPLFELWHTMYSIKHEEECKNALIKKFGIEEEKAIALAKIDLNKQAYGNKSNKAMRKILPYLMQGFVYSDASSFAGYNHSNSLTKDKKVTRELKTKLDLLPKNNLRQPIVEKILNQLINVVNSIIDKHGKIDEIRIELARELKQSKDERNDAFISNEANNRINQEIDKRLVELGVKATKKTREKYKFIFPIRTVYTKEGRFDSKKFENAQILNQCIYCGESFSLANALNGNDFDVDHIIPKSLLFDDSITNRVLVHRKCNATDKKDKTAYDFIRAKGESELNSYLERINDWYKKGILSFGKLERLKISHEDYLIRKQKNKVTDSDKKIWEDFIERQKKETQYISKKAKEILEGICNEVVSTSGQITEKLRRLWGWDDVLMNLQLEKYRNAKQTDWVEWETDHRTQTHKKEIIKGWTKRDDHRHHAIDALVIASTTKSFIHRINTLNSQRESIKAEIDSSKNVFKEKLSLLDKYIILQKPFTTAEVEKEADKILVSFKAGKKVATLGTRKVKIPKFNKKGNKIKKYRKEVSQEHIIIPRGSLSEESVYGKIKTIQPNTPLKALFENSDLIINDTIKSLIKERIAKCDNDSKKAFASTKKDPIYLDKAKEKVLETASLYKVEYVIKYSLGTIDTKKAEKIVDEGLKKIVKVRLEEFGGNAKNAFAKPLYLDVNQKIEIKSVRCFTGLSAVEPIITEDKTNNLQFEKYVKPGNNHHIALYRDSEGKLQEHVASFWHAVERKKYSLPVIISNPTETWDKITVSKNEYPESFLEKLPTRGWKLELTLQQNEMYVLGMSEEDYTDTITNNKKDVLSKYLYRVQKIAESNYMFRHHLETELIDTNEAKDSKRFINVRSIGTLEKLNPKKVWIDVLGNITSISKPTA
ncbi:MAG: type II CRISPR RNA-guided endonuclease Cas9 [Cytophagales bacterium]